MPNNWKVNLPDTFKKGERLAASKLNQLVEAVANILQTRYGFGTERPTEICGKLDGPLAPAVAFATAPGTATMSVWIKNISGDLEDSGRNETVVTRLMNLETLATSTIVYAMWIEGEWTVFMADCQA